MGFLRRKRRDSDEFNEHGYHEYPSDDAEPSGDNDRKPGYSVSMADRMRRLETYSYEFDENEAEEVEARIRRMFYGAKQEDE